MRFGAQAAAVRISVGDRNQANDIFPGDRDFPESTSNWPKLQPDVATLANYLRADLINSLHRAVSNQRPISFGGLMTAVGPACVKTLAGLSV